MKSGLFYDTLRTTYLFMVRFVEKTGAVLIYLTVVREHLHHLISYD